MERELTIANAPRAMVFSWQMPAITGMSLRHIDRLEKAGTFPPKLRLGARRVAWDAQEVALWQKGEWKKNAEGEKPH